jgi:cob(I)alamin adenosyltransferase
MTMAPMTTGSGDDGFTGLLGEGRVKKCDLQPEAYGSVDEASAVLGLARSLARTEGMNGIVIQIQQDLHDLMAELAASPEAVDQFRRLDQERVGWLEGLIDRYALEVSMPQGFVFAGETTSGAVFDLARTMVRRAERSVARLHFEGEIEYPYPLVYLNRLSSLCFLLSLIENQDKGQAYATPAKDSEE